MKTYISFRSVWLMLALIGIFQIALGEGPMPAMIKSDIKLKSLTSIAFNNDGILFLADPLGMKIYALDENRKLTDKPQNIDVPDIDEKIAALLGVSIKDIKIEDMAVNPVSGEVYFAVTRRGTTLQSVIVKTGADGKLSAMNLSNVNHYETSLNDIPGNSPDQFRPLTAAITDLAFIEGDLYVAGLSGEEFSSKLRRFNYPFTNETRAVKLEIFHPSHDRFETHAPIETFLPFPVNGKMHIIAGYGCAPLAKFPLSDLKEKEQLRGVTVAELGGGNRPLDMISFNDDGVDYIVIANSNRTLMQIASTDLDKQRPLEKGPSRVPIYASAGVNYLSIAEVGVVQLADFNPQNYLVLQRNVDDGSLNLRSLAKLRPSVQRMRTEIEALRVAGKLDESENLIAKFELTGDQRSASIMYYNLACSYALAGKSDKAFNLLEKAMAKGFVSKDQYDSDPDLVSLRSDKRWTGVAARLK